jgi:hypothetical protein
MMIAHLQDGESQNAITRIGIAETLRTLELACPPYQVSNEQLIRMVVEEIEKQSRANARRI